MTITSVQTLLPGRFGINSTEKHVAKNPPTIYNAQDHPFKGYHPPQTEGYERSKANPDTSAIVIDNGALEYTMETWDRAYRRIY